MDGNTISVSNTNFDLIKPLPEPHALFSRTGEILYLNPACLKFLKLHQTADDPSTLFGGEQGELRRRLASWSASGQFTPQHLRVKVGDAWVACIGNGARVSVGESVGILVRLRPKQDAHKRFLELNRKVQELASEVEVRRRVELELREAEAKAVAASRAKDSLMANVSHELRTPMNGVLGMAELLLEKGLPQPQQEYAEAIRSSAEHLLEIVNSILDLSKLESGGIEPATVEFDPLHLVEEVLALLSHRASDGVQTAVLGDLPGRVRVQGAATSIRQILLNLVGNSLKFTSHGSVVVRCRVEQHCLYYDIQDSGIGIPADRLTDIFEPFSQIDRGASRKYQGTGLGLTITQRIVNLLNGCIAVESECDVGTTFRLEIPIVVTATESQVVHQRGKALLLSPRRFPLEDVLQEAGFEVDWTNRGEGLDESRQFDLVLCATPGNPLEPECVQARTTVLLGYQRENTDERIKALFLRSPASARRLLDVLDNSPPNTRTTLIGEDSREPLPKDYRVAVVDDNPINRRVTSLQIERLGCSPLVAEDGPSALACLRERPVDLLLLDLQMPEMDGYEVAHTIQTNPELYGSPVIIALTAHAADSDRQRCLELGFQDYLSKPIRSADLSNLLHKWASTKAGS